jgi:hypothetical protein
MPRLCKLYLGICHTTEEKAQINLRWGWVVNATPRPFYLRERPGTHCIGGWVGPRAGLEGCGKYRSHRDLILGPSSPSESLYQLRYPDPQIKQTPHIFANWWLCYITHPHCQPLFPIAAFLFKKAKKFFVIEVVKVHTARRLKNPCHRPCTLHWRYSSTHFNLGTSK